MTKNETVKRYLLFIISLFFIGLGIALTKRGELGVSPVSSIANVVSCKFTFISFGTWLFISNCVLLLGQVLLLRKDFKLYQLLQIPLSVLFGYFTDFGMFLSSFVPNESYAMKLVLVFMGIVVLGFGIGLGVIADVILNSAEAFVKALAQVTQKSFGDVKVIFDVCWVLISIVLSLWFFDMKLVGVREGTVISAFCVGFVVKFVTYILKKPLNNILS